MNWSKLKHGQKDNIAQYSFHLFWVQVGGNEYLLRYIFCNWMYQPNEDYPLKKQKVY